MNTNSSHWTPDALWPISNALEQASPSEIVQWGLDTFGDGLVMATGFGLSGIVIAHHLSKLDPNATVYYLDTDLLFPETHTLKDRLAERLGLTFKPIVSDVSLQRQTEEQGAALWARNPNQCCFIRKVVPLHRFLRDKGAWITGIRRDQSPTRARTSIVEWDHANGLVKLNPLAHWTKGEVWTYIRLLDLPYNALHDQGYPSIGCWPCTQPVVPGQGERAGRWSGSIKTECGIHLQPRAA